MSEPSVWIPIVFSGLMLLGMLANSFMDFGGWKQKAKEGSDRATAASAKTDLIAAQLNEFKVQAAQNFASLSALRESEARLAAAVEGIRSDFRGFTERFDVLMLQIAKFARQDSSRQD